MNPSPLGRIDRILRMLLPGFTVFMAVLLTVLPLGLPDLPVVMPFFTLMAIYYWTVARPDLLAAPLMFLIGMLQDGLAGTPLGLSAIVFLTAHYFVITQRRLLAGQSFALNWFGFSVLAVMAGGLAWAIACVFYLRLVPVTPSAIQTVLTIVLYPPLAWTFAQIHRLLPRPV